MAVGTTQIWHLGWDDLVYRVLFPNL